MGKINDVADNVYEGSIGFLTTTMDTAMASYNETIDDCDLYLEALDAQLTNVSAFAED